MSYFMCDVESTGPCPGQYSMTEIALIMVTGRANPHRFYGVFNHLPGAIWHPDTEAFYKSTEILPRVTPLSEFERSCHAPTMAGIWHKDDSKNDLLREDHNKSVMSFCNQWVVDTNRQYGKGRPIFISDNNGFDYQFQNFYSWRYCNSNPFGHSSTNLGSLYKGMVKDAWKGFKHLRQTAHTHHPIDDCIGNIEAMLTMGSWGQIKGLIPEETI